MTENPDTAAIRAMYAGVRGIDFAYIRRLCDALDAARADAHECREGWRANLNRAEKAEHRCAELTLLLEDAEAERDEQQAARVQALQSLRYVTDLGNKSADLATTAEDEMRQARLDKSVSSHALAMANDKLRAAEARIAAAVAVTRGTHYNDSAEMVGDMVLALSPLTGDTA